MRMELTFDWEYNKKPTTYIRSLRLESTKSVDVYEKKTKSQ